MGLMGTRLLNMTSRESGENSEDDFGLLGKPPHFLGPRPIDSKFNFFKVFCRLFIFLKNIVL